MPSIFKMLPLIIGQNIGKQVLERLAEPNRVTDKTDNVLQYDKVLETKLAISYAIGIETIYRARPEPFGGRALDICCGPGHMSITMARELKLESLIGVDLSAPMVKVANANAREQGMLKVSFREADATSLQDFSDNEFDLTTMMDAAHHLSPPRDKEPLDPPTKWVSAALGEMDRVTSPGGLIVVMDLVRLRTKPMTEKYIELLAHDYEKRGLPAFKEDFRDSMYAAWTTHELRLAVPRQSKRQWNLVVPRGLPFAQFLMGFPRERRSPFINRGRIWNDVNRAPVSIENMPDYRLARLMMATAAINSID